MIYRVLTLVAWSTHQLSDRSLDRLAHAMAFLCYRILGFRRGLIRKNIQIAFGPNFERDKADHLGFEATKSLILTVFELIESRYRDLIVNCSVTGGDYLRDALKERKGVYVMSAHIANWEAFAGTICQHFARAYVPAKLVGGRQVNQFLRELRNKYGLQTEERKEKGDSYRIIRQTLEDKNIVGFMQDQSRPGSPRMPFFGQSAKTNVSMAGIWRRHQAPMIPAFCRRTSPRHHELTILPPMKFQVTEDEKADVLANADKMNRIVEQMIRSNPEQYLWFHDRWK